MRRLKTWQRFLLLCLWFFGWPALAVVLDNPNYLLPIPASLVLAFLWGMADTMGL